MNSNFLGDERPSQRQTSDAKQDQSEAIREIENVQNNFELDYLLLEQKPVIPNSAKKQQPVASKPLEYFLPADNDEGTAVRRQHFSQTLKPSQISSQLS